MSLHSKQDTLIYWPVQFVLTILLAEQKTKRMASFTTGQDNVPNWARWEIQTPAKINRSRELTVDARKFWNQLDMNYETSFEAHSSNHVRLLTSGDVSCGKKLQSQPASRERLNYAWCHRLILHEETSRKRKHYEHRKALKVIFQKYDKANDMTRRN